jgi:hypothetical protein
MFGLMLGIVGEYWVLGSKLMVLVTSDQIQPCGDEFIGQINMMEIVFIGKLKPDRQPRSDRRGW